MATPSVYERSFGQKSQFFDQRLVCHGYGEPALSSGWQLLSYLPGLILFFAAAYPLVRNKSTWVWSAS